MQVIEKSAVPTTIGQVIHQYFHTDRPVHQSALLLRCWVTVLCNLDHSQNAHLTLSDIQLISDHLLCFQHLAENQSHEV